MFAKKNEAYIPLVTNVDEWYQNLCETILEEASYVGDGKRTTEGYYPVFGAAGRFKVTNSLPLLTTKQVFTKGIIHEVIWMMRGDTTIKYLKENNVNIWDSWVDPKTAKYDDDGNLIDGDLPHVYQEQWFNWKGPDGTSFNQVKEVLDKLNSTNKVNCRRKIISTWNVPVIPKMALAACHCFVQFHSEYMDLEERIHRAFEENKISKIEKKTYLSALKIAIKQDDEDGISKLSYIVSQRYPFERKLSVQMYQRSCDVALGLPFNLVQYSLFLHIFALLTNHSPEHLIWNGGDVHLYENQLEGIREQLRRNSKKEKNYFKLLDFRQDPRVCSCEDLSDDITEQLKYLTFDHFNILNYVSHPPIKFPQAAV